MGLLQTRREEIHTKKKRESDIVTEREREKLIKK